MRGAHESTAVHAAREGNGLVDTIEVHAALHACSTAAHAAERCKQVLVGSVSTVAVHQPRRARASARYAITEFMLEDR